MQKSTLSALRRVCERVGRALAKRECDVRSEAFREALKPIERRVSKLVSTSRGHSWYPRRMTYRILQVPGTSVSRMAPRRGYELDWHGTLRRTAAKVNKCSKRRAAACAA
jgi:hypothetical protein